MPIRFKCSSCRARLSVTRRKAGTIANCPKCGAKISIPGFDGLPDTSTGDPAEAPVDDLSSSLPLPEPIKPVSTRGKSVATVRKESAEIPRPSVRTKSEPVSKDRWRVEEQPAEDPRPDAIWVPRWIVYCQAALLGVVASTFFLFGMMIGNVTSSPAAVTSENFECELSGSVLVRKDGSTTADEGAVVMVLPVDAQPNPRPDPETLRPDDFEPLENPSIKAIESFGGRVVRIGREGRFQLPLAAPGAYYVLVISKSKRREIRELTKQQVADVGQFFFPVEDLVERKDFRWTRVNLRSESHQLKTITF